MFKCFSHLLKYTLRYFSLFAFSNSKMKVPVLRTCTVQFCRPHAFVLLTGTQQQLLLVIMRTQQFGVSCLTLADKHNNYQKPLSNNVGGSSNGTLHGPCYTLVDTTNLNNSAPTILASVSNYCVMSNKVIIKT